MNARKGVIRKMMTELNTLRSLRVDAANADELVALESAAVILTDGFTRNEIPTPEWLAEAISILRAEIKSRRRDTLEKELKAAKARREALKSTEDKRRETDDHIAALEAALAK